jgi:hypothetical protein
LNLEQKKSRETTPLCLHKMSSLTLIGLPIIQLLQLFTLNGILRKFIICCDTLKIITPFKPLWYNVGNNRRGFNKG